MKPPRAYARGILHFFGGIRRSTLLRSSSFGGSNLRIHPRPYSRGLLRRRIKNQGQAAIAAVIFFVAFMVAVTYGFSSIALHSEKITRTIIDGKASFFLAEAGTEDLMYRLATGRSVDSTEVLTLNNSSATVSTSIIDADKEITSVGDHNTHIRKIVTRINVSPAGNTFNYGVQAGAGGIFMENSSEVLGNVFSNGPVTSNNNNVVRGEIISAGPAGLIDGAHATSTGRAHTIQNAVIDGDAYYQTIFNTIVGGAQFPGSSDQAISSLPITDEQINTWEQEAEAGGSITSPCPYKIQDDAPLGPIKIACDVEISGNNFTVTLTGNVWITGNLTISNSPLIRVDPSLGETTIAVITDNPVNRLSSSKVMLQNSAVFEGSGADNSYILLISQNNSSESGGSEIAIELKNSASGDLLLYAPHGEILQQNNNDLREITAYKIHLKNNAKVIYESGLANLLFTSGPSGGGIDIKRWQEAE